MKFVCTSTLFIKAGLEHRVGLRFCLPTVQVCVTISWFQFLKLWHWYILIMINRFHCSSKLFPTASFYTTHRPIGLYLKVKLNYVGLLIPSGISNRAEILRPQSYQPFNLKLCFTYLFWCFPLSAIKIGL